VRALAFLIPLVAGYFAGAYVADRLAQPSTVAGVIFWWVFVIAVASLSAHLVDRVTRRMVPLSGLLTMTMAFPDKAPSRFKVAQRASNITVLKRRIEEATATGQHDTAGAAELILSLASALSNHDRKTRGHSERTRAYTDLLAEEMKLSEPDRDRLRWAALLHDVGKLEVPAEILNKDGTLDPHEWDVVRRHPVEGMRLVAPIAAWLGPWAKTIEHHHERWDGSGYPYGLHGEEIALGARIVAVADAYDVITTGRSYQPSKAHSAARIEVAKHSGTQFDPRVVRALMNVALGRLRWSTGPLAALADFPFLRPIEALGRDLITMITAGAVTASAAMAGVLPVPDISNVDPSQAAAVVAASLGLETTTTTVPGTVTVSTLPGGETTTTVTVTGGGPGTTTPGSSTTNPPTTTRPPITTGPSTSTTAPSSTTTTAPPTTLTTPPPTTTTAPPTTTTTAPPTTTTTTLPPGCGPAITVNANSDAWIEQNSPDNNKGSDSILKVKAQGAADNFRALVDFNLPNLPNGCVVQSATLRLFAASSTGGRTLQAFRLANGWGEGGVTWNNQPGTAGGAATTSSGSGYRLWNVTNILQAMYDSGGDHGFLVRDSNESGGGAEQQFHAREKGESPPQLVIQFGLP
jgi:putative nucleotidyltransferase with HDIG domain